MLGHYLHLTSSGKYRFRMRVPKELQGKLGKTEFRRSLHTDSREEALALAVGLGARYKLEFIRMKKRQKAKRRPTDNELSVGLVTFLTPSGGEFRIDYDGDADREQSAATKLYEHAAAIDAKYDRKPETIVPPAASTPTSEAPLLSECVTSYLSEQKLKGTREKSIAD